MTPGNHSNTFIEIDRQVEAKLYTLIKFENEMDLSLLIDFS